MAIEIFYMISILQDGLYLDDLENIYEEPVVEKIDLLIDFSLITKVKRKVND